VEQSGADGWQQMACQVVHYPYHSQVVTQPAPEPRDVVWAQIGISHKEGLVRVWVAMAAMVVLLLFWIRKYAYPGSRE
jgi:hypothetical protein